MDTNELIRALEVFGKVDPEMQIQTMLAFLVVARKGSCSQKEVETELGLTNAGTSRNVSYWTHRRFDKKPGVGYIRREEDDNDRRFKKLYLTREGQAFYTKLKGNSYGKTPSKQVDRGRDGK